MLRQFNRVLGCKLKKKDFMKYLIVLFVLSANFAFAETHITYSSTDGIEIEGRAQYLATRDSRLCKRSYIDEGGRRVVVPKRTYETIKAENYQLVIPEKLDSFCRYKKLSGEIRFVIPGKAKPIRNVEIRRVENPRQNLVECEIIQYGPRGRRSPHLSCNTLTIEVDSNGVGSVEVGLK